MSIVPIDGIRQAVSHAEKPQGIWRGLIRRLDALVAHVSKHALSEQELRRADADISRCRALFSVARGFGNGEFARVRLHPVPLKIR